LLFRYSTYWPNNLLKFLFSNWIFGTVAALGLSHRVIGAGYRITLPI
jgi:hypothetical protein